MADDYSSFDSRQLLVLTPKDPEAFAAFYRRHVDQLLSYFLRRTRDAETALDLTAETFAAALEGTVRYEVGEAPAEAWLFGIARNKLLHSQRRGRVDEQVRRRLEMEPVVLDDAGIAEIERRAGTDMSRLLERLPEEQRQAIEAHILEDRDYGSIAQELRCSASVIRQRVSRGLRRLRNDMEAAS